MDRSRHPFLSLWAPLLLVTLLFTSGCGAVRGAFVSSGTETLSEIVKSIGRQPDVELVRDGLPTMILILDGLVAADPENPEILAAACDAYLGYVQAFVDGRDADRSRILYRRAREYALRALDRKPAFAAARESGRLEEYERALADTNADDAPALHRTAAAWLGLIIADSDSMETLSELPQALAIAERALELDETYGQGSGHLVFAIFYAAQPRGAGQDLDRSGSHFARAIEIAGPGQLFPFVLRAEFIGKATLDQEFFVEELTRVLQVDLEQYPESRFLNELARERARDLLTQQDDIF